MKNGNYEMMLTLQNVCRYGAFLASLGPSMLAKQHLYSALFLWVDGRMAPRVEFPLHHCSAGFVVYKEQGTLLNVFINKVWTRIIEIEGFLEITWIIN